MNIIVQKYGGSSLENIDKIKIIANKIIKEKENNTDLVVVVSAQGKTTDTLIEKAKEYSNYDNLNLSKRDLDFLLSTGEMQSASLLSIFLNSKGYKSTCITGFQAGILTDSNFGSAKILDIEHLLKRKPKALSGGQRQRVALGRAIVRHPKVFLMDEPLSNLDAKLRVQMRTEIIKLYRKLETTFIYVTHDQVEAMTMGTRIVVMKDGIVQQVDTPQNIYNKPANLFVAGFIGSPQMNFLDGKIEKEGNDIVAIFEGNKIVVPENNAKILVDKGYVGKYVTLGLRPEHLSDDADLSAINPNSIVKGNVEVIELMGAESYIYTKCGKSPLNVRTEGTTNLKIGDVAKLYLRAERLHVFDKETEIRIV